ncbi:17898_t:CDS:2, partial [Gigaspora margarita]
AFFNLFNQIQKHISSNLHNELNEIPYAISHHVCLKFNIEQELDIELAIEGICRISVAHLEPERSKEICPDRLIVDQLKIQLTNRRVSYNYKSIKQDMISFLNNILFQELEFQETGIINCHKQGWILKENQKFEKRDRGKKISKHIITYLKGYFLAVKVDSLEESDVPKMLTIQN